MRISDWSSDVCSSDLGIEDVACDNHMFHLVGGRDFADPVDGVEAGFAKRRAHLGLEPAEGLAELPVSCVERSEEHTSELQSLMRISYAVFCLKKKKTHNYSPQHTTLKNEIQKV